MFRDFLKAWDKSDLYQHKQMLGLVVKKVGVKGYEISAITLGPSYHLVVSGLKQAVDETGGKENPSRKIMNLPDG